MSPARRAPASWSAACSGCGRSPATSSTASARIRNCCGSGATTWSSAPVRERGGARARYADAWLLIDRDSSAQDNAEHLYRHLRAHEPDVNAWFVLRRDSTDWDRLRAEGFRLLEHGTTRVLDGRRTVRAHRLVPDRPLRRGTHRRTPAAQGRLAAHLPPARRHEGRPVALDQQEADRPDGHRDPGRAGARSSPTGRRTCSPRARRAMTGFPRHDRLLALGRASTPTTATCCWSCRPGAATCSARSSRAATTGHSSPGSGRPSTRGSGGRSSSRQQLREAAEAAGVHVDVRAAPEHAGLPATTARSRRTCACTGSATSTSRTSSPAAAVLVTDYSSMAFEAAYLERPVVYFQFDAERFFAGGHAYRQGTWSYRDRGFGPVTTEADDAVAAVADLAARGFAAAEPYAARMRDTFPLRDGQCCARTTAAIRALRRPVTPLAPAGSHVRIHSPLNRYAFQSCLTASLEHRQQVAILAAGRGTRLGTPHPKPLTPLRDGRTILGNQLELHPGNVPEPADLRRRRLQAGDDPRGPSGRAVRLQRGLRRDQHLQEPAARAARDRRRQRAVDERRRGLRRAAARSYPRLTSTATSPSSR